MSLPLLLTPFNTRGLGSMGSGLEGAHCASNEFQAGPCTSMGMKGVMLTWLHVYMFTWTLNGMGLELRASNHPWTFAIANGPMKRGKHVSQRPRDELKEMIPNRPPIIFFLTKLLAIALQWLSRGLEARHLGSVERWDETDQVALLESQHWGASICSLERHPAEGGGGGGE